MNFGELGVLVETYSGHRRFLKPCLESVRDLRASQYVVAYSTDLDKSVKYSLTDVMPPFDVMSLADMWLTADYGQKVNGWLWLTKFGLALLAKGGKDIPPPKYVFAIEGDCIITRGKGIHDLENAMVADGTDIICAEYTENCVAGAVSYLAKTEAIVKIVDLMVEEAYKRDDPNGQQYGNIEGRFAKAIKMCGYKCSLVKNPTHSQFSYGYRGSWGDMLGFRHLHGTEKWRQGVHHKPLPKSCYDTRYLSGGELAALEYFWSTNDTSKLQEMGYWSNTTEELLQQGKVYAEAI